MEKDIEILFEQSATGDKEARFQAYEQLIEITDHPVDWAYEVWDELMERLVHSDPHQRSRAAQYLAGLAKSDPENRMLNDFPKLWNMTYDEKTVTARHSLQAIWKVGLAGPRQKEWIIQFFTERFAACESEKHPTMIRGDLLEGLRKLYDAKEDERLCETAHKLIESIEDAKYHKKYTAIWK